MRIFSPTEHNRASGTMLRNYLTVALRSLQRRKGYAFVNIFGLAIGIAVSLLLFQYVRHALSYDAFHEDGDRIYRIRHDRYQEGEPVGAAATTFPGVGPALLAEFPDVEAFARVTRRYGGGVVRFEDRAFREQRVFHADPSFLTLFSYPMLRGNPGTALQEPNTAVLSAEAARKYFGDQDPLGRRILFGSDEVYVITGVVESPATSHLRFDFLFSYPTLAQLWSLDLNTSWTAMDFMTYIRLRPDTDPRRLEAAFPAFIEKYRPAASTRQIAFTLQPLRDIHLHSDLLFEAGVNGRAEVVYAITLIGLLILVIAWFNYINLSTARAVERAREIGVRKAIGAQQRQLIGQFLLESCVLNLLAGALALLLAQLLLPTFNQLTGITMHLDAFRTARFWLAFVVFFSIGAFLAGLYPAFVLSTFRPILVLKGRPAAPRRGMSLRQGLVVVQFAVTVALVAGTLIVHEQLLYMQRQHLGVDVDQTLVVNTPGVMGNNATYTGQFESFKQALLQHPRIRHVAVSSEVPGAQDPWVNGALRLGAPDEARASLFVIAVDYEYLEGYNHRLLAGRFLSRAFPADAQGLVLNETAVQVLGLGTPEAALNARIRMPGDTLTVVGVVADHHQQGLDEAFYQIGFRIVPEEYRYFSIKVGTDDLPGTIAAVEQTYRTFFPDTPFSYTFLDLLFDEQYHAYRQFGRVVGVFALLALIVAGLGLFGLSAFTVAQRTREIGIRKVLGASLTSILGLLSRYFLKLVLLGSLIAVPVAWYAMHQWLSGFAFRIAIRPHSFLLAGGIALFVVVCTVGYQAIRAARSHPVKALRTE